MGQTVRGPDRDQPPASEQHEAKVPSTGRLCAADGCTPSDEVHRLDGHQQSNIHPVACLSAESSATSAAPDIMLILLLRIRLDFDWCVVHALIRILSSPLFNPYLGTQHSISRIKTWTSYGPVCSAYRAHSGDPRSQAGLPVTWLNPLSAALLRYQQMTSQRTSKRARFPHTGQQCLQS